MSDAMQFHSRVGDDGILNVQVNLGREVAEKEVVVTIEAALGTEKSEQRASLAWPDFVGRTYGSCSGFGLERHDQGVLESREKIE